MTSAYQASTWNVLRFVSFTTVVTHPRSADEETEAALTAFIASGTVTWIVVTSSHCGIVILLEGG